MGIKESHFGHKKTPLHLRFEGVTLGIKESHFGHKPHGGVGVMTFFCTCTHVRFYTFATHHMGWGGVGMLTFFCTCTHVRLYTLGTHHMGWGGVGTMTFFCTCTHVRLYTLGTHHMGWGGVGMMTFLCTSTQVRFYTLGTHRMGWGGGDDDVLLHLHTCETLHFGHASHGMGWVGMLTFFCACAHVRLYTLGTHHMGWGGVGVMRSFALAHM